MVSRPRVLVVEDDEDIRESLVEVLLDHGYASTSAVHGLDALRKLKDPAQRPSLILLDLMMPVMDGRAFREHQLSEPALATIPVVVISAFRDQDRMVSSLKPAAFLPKPIDLPALLRAIEVHALPTQ
jgi:CheY-like chemotaxis protein